MPQKPWEMQWGTQQAPQSRPSPVYGAPPTPKEPKEPKDTWRTLSPDEATKRGLPAGAWQMSTSGKIEPVSGATGKNAADQPYSQAALDSFDRALSSIDELKKHPGFQAAVGSGFDPHSWGSYNPFTGQTLAGTSAAGFEARLKSLEAQVFLPMVQSLKGMGALSDAEGKKLAASIGALDPKMPESDFLASLNDIRNSLLKYRKRAELMDPSAKQQTAPSPNRSVQPKQQAGGWGKAIVVGN